MHSMQVNSGTELLPLLHEWSTLQGLPNAMNITDGKHTAISELHKHSGTTCWLYDVLIHQGLPMHICISQQAHHWFMESIVNCHICTTAPCHYLKQCWLIVNWTLRNNLQWNLSQWVNVKWKHYLHRSAEVIMDCLIFWGLCWGSSGTSLLTWKIKWNYITIYHTQEREEL